MRALVDRSVRRLLQLCAKLLNRNYSRLSLPPLNLQPDEILSPVVESLLKAMRSVRPQTAYHFFGLVNQRMRWELNDLARRLDEQATAAELNDALGPRSAIQSALVQEINDGQRRTFVGCRIR